MSRLVYYNDSGIVLFHSTKTKEEVKEILKQKKYDYNSGLIHITCLDFTVKKSLFRYCPFLYEKIDDQQVHKWHMLSKDNRYDACLIVNQDHLIIWYIQQIYNNLIDVDDHEDGTPVIERECSNAMVKLYMDCCDPNHLKYVGTLHEIREFGEEI